MTPPGEAQMHTAHTGVWWATVGWWWAPLAWSGRVLLWLVLWPAGLWRSWRHHQHTNELRSRNEFRSVTAWAAVLWIMKGLGVVAAGMVAGFIIVSLGMGLWAALHKDQKK